MPIKIKTEELLDVLKWRYATKVFDSTKKIPSNEWAALEDALVLTPSSYGLQPWKFQLVTNQGLREKLVAASWNQKQVVDASHFMVFTAKTDVTAEDVEHWVARLAEVQGVSKDTLQIYNNIMMNDLVKGPRHGIIQSWAARQTYIALGNFMTSAALLGIDTCPMEGIDAMKYDELLNLRDSGYATVCACAAGYRSAADKYAALPKARYPKSEVIQTI